MSCGNKGDTVICRCEEVTRQEILEALADGARDLRGVRIRTRAGMGLCQGKTCERLVRQIIAEQTGVNPAELRPATKRPPVRPLEIGLLGRDDDDSVK
ncbi:MAG: (2Fe-2S)-binding protein [Bacillota bacterium]|nr:(2Fe-2S)-binding protein [Bacillota bacterium]